MSIKRKIDRVRVKVKLGKRSTTFLTLCLFVYILSHDNVASTYTSNFFHMTGTSQIVYAHLNSLKRKALT